MYNFYKKQFSVNYNMISYKLSFFFNYNFFKIIQSFQTWLTNLKIDDKI